MSEVEIRAFPTSVRNEGISAVTGFDGDTVEPGTTNHYPGMSLRDYFAAKAMQAIYSNDDALMRRVKSNISSLTETVVSAEAYLIADAMIVERAK